MSKLPEPPKAINPLWIIFMFFSFTEIVLGAAIFYTIGGIQIALTIFAIVFPLLVAIGFFILLWSRPEHLYAPKDYESDKSFLKGIESSRASRESLVDLETVMQEKLNTVLTSDEFIKRLSNLQGEQLKDVLKATATNITNEVRETKFFTVALSPISPGLKDLVLPIDGFTDFNDLTNEIYFALNGAIEPYTYGKSWVIKEKVTGKIFKHVKMITNATEERFMADYRTLDEIGIKAGMSLEVAPP